jgi:hypothetical protein
MPRAFSAGRERPAVKLLGLAHAHHHTARPSTVAESVQVSKFVRRNISDPLSSTCGIVGIAKTCRRNDRNPSASIGITEQSAEWQYL